MSKKATAKKDDLPLWYHEFSLKQFKLIDSFLSKLTYDLFNDTTDHCEKFLCKLKVDSKQQTPEILKILIRQSKGNDMKFLLYYMSVFYCDDGFNGSSIKTTKEYNISQRIILSAIAHLDMISTFQELDRILPKSLIQIERLGAILYENVVHNNSRIGNKKIKFSFEMYYDTERIIKNKVRQRILEENEKFVDKENRKADIKFISEKVKDVTEQILSEDFTIPDFSNVGCRKHKYSMTNQNISKGTKSKAVMIENLKKILQTKFDLKEIYQERIKTEIRYAVNRERKRMMESKDDLAFIREILYNTIDERFKIDNEENSNENAEMTNNNTVSSEPNIQSETPSVETFDSENFNCDKNRIRNKYFYAPRKNKSWKFNYENIYKDENENENNSIKIKVNNALNLNKYGSEDDAIEQYLMKVWKDKFELINNESDFDIDEKHIPLVLNIPVQKLSRINNVENYDPNDDELMNTLLFNAIKEMKKNPKFIFVTLENCHKLPILNEWIRARYGLIK